MCFGEDFEERGFKVVLRGGELRHELHDCGW